MRRLKFEHRVLGLAALAALPALVAAVVLLARGGTLRATLLGAGALAAWALLCIWRLRRHLRRPLLSLANQVAGLREGDFSVRLPRAGPPDALGDVFREVNELTEILHEQRLGAIEATALLRKVMEEIEVAVFTFDPDRRLRLVNRAGEKLAGRPAEQLLGKSADQLGLAGCLEGDPGRLLERSFSGAFGRWSMRRSVFRDRGVPHHLLVLTDLSRALRDEERQAWQRLVRVIGHELNNSLAPIKSIAGSLAALLARQPRPDDWEADVQHGLGIINTRAASLGRFMEAYARLARLPAPKLAAVPVAPCVARVAKLETRFAVAVEPGPALTLRADADQLEQLLINLIRNAADAALAHGESAAVGVTWSRAGDECELCVADNGPGLANTANLFVPFFTTKPGGSGIGLALCRQIAEAHGGRIALENRTAGPGCVARVWLPLEAAAQ
ncbi:MAG: sensor histidine kinase [Limisphaerales bacterium]